MRPAMTPETAMRQHVGEPIIVVLTTGQTISGILNALVYDYADDTDRQIAGIYVIEDNRGGGGTFTPYHALAAIHRDTTRPDSRPTEEQIHTWRKDGIVLTDPDPTPPHGIPRPPQGRPTT